MHFTSRGKGLIVGLALAVVALLAPVAPVQAQAPAKKPNILVIFGDDIGQSNISAYTHRLMGCRRPTSTGSRGKA